MKFTLRKYNPSTNESQTEHYETEQYGEGEIVLLNHFMGARLCNGVVASEEEAICLAVNTAIECGFIIGGVTVDKEQTCES